MWQVAIGKWYVCRVPCAIRGCAVRVCLCAPVACVRLCAPVCTRRDFVRGCDDKDRQPRGGAGAVALWHPDASRIATRPVSSVVLILAQRHRRGESSTIARCPRRPKLRGACLWLGINACTKFQLVPRRRDRMSDERKCTSHRQGFSASVLNMQYPSTQRRVVC